MKKMLAILGSPRENGNISKMLDCVVISAKDAGWQVDIVNLYEQNIAWCKGCGACQKSGICVINDDIGPIRQTLIACDVVALAAPTYFANVPGPVKNMFDRLVGAVMDDRGFVPKPRLRKTQQYLLLTACNTPFPFNRLARQSTGATRAMKEFFHIAGMKKLGQVVFAGSRNKTELPPAIRKKIARICAFPIKRAKG
ncbi:MAG: flavodoxin family protein [Synergistaceae bacterium]|jgi:multimeric flavodoxin WrbA|nr:flavodoxin family protein [Synergistaceae bacterium]